MRFLKAWRRDQPSPRTNNGKDKEQPQKTETEATLIIFDPHSVKDPGSKFDAQSQHKPDSSSFYHIYHHKQRRHFMLTPIRHPEKERVFSCSKSLKKVSKQTRQDEKVVDNTELENETNSYMVHQPYLSFKHPPRTMRRGICKTGPTFCILHNSLFWRKWKLQFGERLAENGVIDPRGVVGSSHGVSEKELGEVDLKGYKVRRWRLYGESGKEYHRQINMQRKQGLANDDEKQNEVEDRSPLVDEVIYLDWNSPFSKNTRRYHFRHSGIDFYWKGTGTTKHSRLNSVFLRYNHLKLVALVPVDRTSPVLDMNEISNGQKDLQSTEISLAKYTSSWGNKKSGILEVYDDAISRLTYDHSESSGESKIERGKDFASIKSTRTYQVVVATAMCMIISEWQKRETLKKIIEILISAGVDGAPSN